TDTVRRGTVACRRAPAGRGAAHAAAVTSPPGPSQGIPVTAEPIRPSLCRSLAAAGPDSLAADLTGLRWTAALRRQATLRRRAPLRRQAPERRRPVSSLPPSAGSPAPCP